MGDTPSPLYGKILMMSSGKSRFPDPASHPNPDGIIAIGGTLTTETLLDAYRQGIFPWPIEGLPLTWFCPPKRAILEFKDLHVPESLRRFIRKTQDRYLYTVDRIFPEVIRICSEIPRRGEHGTWITPEIIDAYIELHRLGYAHSIEVWRDDALVGGIYGVEVDGVFAAESMFHRESNTSKLALLRLIEHLKNQGLDWMDVQVLTPHMERLGARLVLRKAFLKKLHQSFDRRRRLFTVPQVPSSPS